jgi:hypothetical protein
MRIPKVYYDCLMMDIHFIDGKPYWKNNKIKSKIGALAGSINNCGYRILHSCYNNQSRVISAHRMHWYIIHKRVPIGWIDHINGVRDDNRIENLRECTPSQNSRNRQLGKDNTSGFTGVSFNEKKQQWEAQIILFNSRKHLGSFTTKEEAIQARLEGENKYWRHDGFLPRR